MNIPIKITSDYSLLKSLITIDKLILSLKENNINACGLCDNNLYGSYSFYKACKNNNIKPIIGLEILIDDCIIYLYAKNFAGYKNLLKLNYISQERDISLLDINKYNDNLIFIVPYESRKIAKYFKNY